MALSPFDFVNSVSSSKQDIFNNDTEAEYVPFVVNRALSYHADCILSANLMNLYNNLPKRSQYSFYLNSLRPRKRYAKWVKKDNEGEGSILSFFQEAFKLTEKDAKIAISLLSEEQIEQLITRQKNIGGVSQDE